MDWLTFFKMMMLDERGAQAKYRLAAERAQDLQVQATLQKLADEEGVHLALLEQEYARLEQILKWSER